MIYAVLSRFQTCTNLQICSPNPYPKNFKTNKKKCFFQLWAEALHSPPSFYLRISFRDRIVRKKVKLDGVAPLTVALHQLTPPLCPQFFQQQKNLSSYIYSFFSSQIKSETWHLTCDTWQRTPDTGHLTPDTWRMTYDTWHTGGGEHCVKIAGS